MKKWLIKTILVLIAVALLIPMPAGLDDGGTTVYTAVLYEVRKQHSMWNEGQTFGYLTGTTVRILFFEVYNDVKFVPAERK